MVRYGTMQGLPGWVGIMQRATNLGILNGFQVRRKRLNSLHKSSLIRRKGDQINDNTLGLLPFKYGKVYLSQTNKSQGYMPFALFSMYILF